MAIHLVFDKGTATGQPVHLVFGDDGGSGGNTVPLTLAATLPALGAHITAGKRSALSVSASLPGPRVAVRLVFSHPAAVAATLPGLGAHVHAQRKRPAALWGALPTPGVHVSLVPPFAAKLVATLPGLSASIALGRIAPLVLRAKLPSLGVSIELDYIVNTIESVVSGTQGRLQDAARFAMPLVSRLQSGATMSAIVRGVSTWSNALASATTGNYQDADPSTEAIASRQQQTTVLPAAPVRSRWQDAIGTPLSTQGRLQDGVPMLNGTSGRYQDADGTKRAWLRAAMQQSAPISALVASAMQHAVFFSVHLQGVEQDAMPPPPGRWPGRPLVPPFDPCYVPPNGLQVHLLFEDPWDNTGHLVFSCKRHGPGPGPDAEIVIPVRRYYVVLNEIVLRRVDGNIELMAYAFSMSIDADSWTWSFSATLRRDALPYLQPDSAGPVEVEALINGVPYRFLVEKIGRDTKFPSVRIRVSGRGLAASLAAPNAPTMSFGNSAPRTAQQLMADVLTINGVSIGWDVDWGLVDWLVPAGAWAMQGSYIDAIVDIAGAVGGYVQPHATAQTLRILPRYPTVPWEWSTVAPYVELPANAASVESVDWIDMPAYNGVYVGGVAKGVFGPFKRTGTAGDVLAPQVNHPLITHASAHRQRGIAEISNTGRQAHYEIKTQLHPAAGLILPGRFIRYVGDATVTGIVRSTKLDWSFPSIRQTLGVETHVIA